MSDKVFSKVVVVKQTDVITSWVLLLNDFKILKASDSSMGLPKALPSFQTIV